MNDDKTLSQSMNEIIDGIPTHPFYCFEPWEPPPETGRRFQTSFLQSTSKINLSVAGNRNGKTLMEAVDAIIMITGKIPISLCHPAGADTGIPRPWKRHKQVKTIDNLNKLRFGLRDPKSGVWTPPVKHPDMECPDDRGPENPCGNIMGVGQYPREKICPQSACAVWIATWSQVVEERWVPLLKEMIPEECLNMKAGDNGYKQRDKKFYLRDGSTINLITYEKGHKRVQGAGIWAVKMDEEPMDRKFWTELDQRLIDAGFSGYMSMSYTPLNGISWSYQDLYKPAMEGQLKHIELFNATQYDSPFITNETIDQKRKSMKPWEIKPRIYGQFSDVKGKPYYDYQKLMGDTDGNPGWVQVFVTNAYYGKLNPVRHTESTTGLFPQVPRIEWLDIQEERENPNQDFWEIYESQVKVDGRYFITADTGEPNPDVGSDIDRSVAYVFRCPMGDENFEWPIMVASMRAGIENAAFGRELILAGQYWNGAVLAPERRGETGATVLAELREYPWKYTCTVHDERTRRPTQKVGFDTTSKTRTPVFDLAGDFICAHENAQCMKHRYLLHEASEIIYGKRGRPDHPDKGTSDCVVAFGIGLYIYRYDRGQVQSHRDELARLASGKNTGSQRWTFTERLDKTKQWGYCKGRHGKLDTRVLA